PGGAAGDGSGVAVPGLAVGQPGAGVAGRGVGGVAIPPGRAGRRPARRRDHGHADLGRGDRRVPVVAVRADLRRGRRDVLEVAAGVTALVLLGRRLEARARRRSGAALRALLSLGAKDVAVRRDGAEVRVPVATIKGNLFWAFGYN